MCQFSDTFILLILLYLERILFMTKKKETKVATLLDGGLINSLEGMNGKQIKVYRDTSEILFNNVLDMGLSTLPTSKASLDRQKIEKAPNGGEVIRIVSLLLKAKSYGLGESFNECWEALEPKNIEGEKMALSKFRKGMRSSLDTHEEKEGIGEFSEAKKNAKEKAKENAKVKNKDNASQILDSRNAKYISEQIEWCKANNIENAEQFVLDQITLNLSVLACEITGDFSSIDNEFPRVEDKSEKKSA